MSAGAIALNLTISQGAFVVSSAGLAGTATVTNASLSGVGGGNSFNFSLTNVSLALNTMGMDEAASVVVGGNTIAFNYNTAATHNFLQVAGTMSLGITTSAVSVNLSGQFGFELTTIGGQQTIAFGLSNGQADLTIGGVTLTASQLGGAFLINSTGVAGWASVGTIAMTPASSIFSFGELANVSVNLNTTGADVTANIAVGSGTSSFTYSGSAQQNFFRVTGTVGLTVSQGGISTKIKGTLTFDRSNDTATNATILRVAVVNASSSFTAGSTTLAITGINGAFVIRNDGFAGQATVGGIQLTGVTGLTFQVTSLLFEINTTNTAVSESIATGGSPIILDFTAPDRQQFFKVEGSVSLGIAMGGISASLSGSFYFEQFTQPDTTKVVKFATLGATATFTAGSITLTASNVNGGFILNQAGIAGFVNANNLSLAGITGVTASATGVEFAINTTGAAAAASFTVGSQTIAFNYATSDQFNFVSAGGTVNLGLTLGTVSMTLTGTIAFQSATLTDGVTHVVKIGGQGLGATVTIGAVVLNITGVEGIVVLTNAGAAGRVKIGTLSVMGISGFSVAATDFAIEFNNTGQSINETLSVGGVSQTLNYQDPAELNFFRGSGTAAIAFSQGGFSTTLSGTFGFEQFTMPDSSSVVKFAFTDVSFDIGLGTGATDPKLAITQANGFFIFSADGYAGKLEIGHAALENVTGLTLDVVNFNFEVNTTGHDVAASITRPSPATPFTLSFTGVDRHNFIDLGGTINLGISMGGFNSTLTGTFYFETAMVDGYNSIKVSVSDASFSLSAGSALLSLSDISGAFLITAAGSAGKLAIGNVALTGVNGFTFTVDDFNLEFNNTGAAVTADIPVNGGSPVHLDYSTADRLNFIAVSGTLDIGLVLGGLTTTLTGSFAFEQGTSSIKLGMKDAAFKIKVGSVSLDITGVNGAFALYNDGVAGKLSIGNVALTGITGLTFTVHAFDFEINNTGRDVTDTVTVGTGMTASLNYLAADGKDNFLAISGTLDIGLSLGGLTTTLTGTFAFEQGTTAVKIGMKDVSFKVQVGSVALNISNVDGAFALYNDGIAGKLSIGNVALTGITGLTFTVDNFNFEINNTGRDVVDTVTVGTGMTANLNYVAADGKDNFLAISGTLDVGLILGGLTTTLTGTFAFEQGTTAVKIGMKDVSFKVQVGSVALNISNVDGAFALYNDGIAGKLSIGNVALTGITGFTFTVQAFDFEINNTGRDVVDTVTVGTGMTASLNYLAADGKDNFLAISGTLDIGLVLGAFTSTLTGTFAFEQGTTAVKIGMKDVSFKVQVGSLALNISDVSGAFALYNDGVAGKLSIGAVSLTGVTGFTFTVNDFNFEINNTGRDVVDTVTVGTGMTASLNYTAANGKQSFFSIGGTLHLGLAISTFNGTLAGTFYFEKATINSQDVFKVSVSDASFSVVFGSVTFSISQIAGAFLISPAGSAGKLTVGSASLTGLPVMLTVTNFSLQFNNTGADVTAVIPVNGGPSVSLSFTGANRHDFFLISGSMSVIFSSYLTLNATDVVVDTGATGTGHVFEAAALSGTLSIPALGNITVTAQNLALTAQGKFDNLTPTSLFIVSVDFGGTGQASSPAGASFQWPAWLPIQISHLELAWADLGNHPDQFILILSAKLSIPAIAGVTVSGEVTNLAIDVGRLVAGDFPIIGFDSAGLSISGTFFGALEVHAGLIVGMIKLDASNNVITDPLTFGVHTVFYAGIDGGAELTAMGVGVEVRIGMAAFTDTSGTLQVVPLEAFIKVSAPLLIEPISGLTIGSFTAGIQFNHVLTDYTDPLSLKAVSIASLTNPDLTHWADDLRASALGIYLGSATGTASVWTLPMTITAGAEFYSSYISKQALDGNVLFQFDTTGKVLIVGELTTGGGNLKLAARLYADFSAAGSGNVHFSFYADAGLAGVPGPPPFAIWGSLSIEVLSSTGTLLVGDPNNPTELDGSGTTVKIAFSGGADITEAGALTMEVTGNVDIEITATASSFTTKLNFNAAVKIVAPVGNPLDHNFAQITGAVVLRIYTDSGGALQFELYGAVKLSFDPGQGLEKYGLDLTADAFLQLNTTASDQAVTLTYIDGHTENITIIKQSFSIYIAGHVGLGTPADPTTHFLEMDGVLVLQIDAAGLSIYVSATIDVGPKAAPVLIFKATGFLRINLTGIAAQLDLTLQTNLPASSGLSLSGNYKLEFNTTLATVTYTTPAFTTSSGTTIAPVTVIIPKSAPALSFSGVDLNTAADPAAAGQVYFLIYEDGSMSAFGTLTLTGKFFVLITTTSLDLGVDATLTLDPVGSIHAHGELHLTKDGAAGLLDATFTTGSALSSVGISISGNFEVAFNTYATPYTLGDGTILKAHLVRVEVDGTASLLGGAISMDGRFFFEQAGSGPTAYTTIEISAHMTLPVLGTVNVDGSLTMTSAGAVGSLNASIVSSSGLSSIGITYVATMQLEVNTTAADAPNPLNTAVNITANTVSLDMSGSVTVANTFTFTGHFYFQKSSSDLIIRFDATLNITIGTFTATGNFDSTAAGFTGLLTLSLQSSPALSSLGFKIHGDFMLAINTTGGGYTLSGLTGTLAAFNGKTVLAHGLKIYVSGGITILDTLELTGTFELDQQPGYLEIYITAHMDLAGLVVINLTGFAGIYSDGIAISLDLNVPTFGISGLFDATGDFAFRLNTTGSVHNSILAHYFEINVTNLTLKFLSVLTITGSLDFTYHLGVFKLSFSAGIDFFGIGNITADGYFDSDGNYSLYIHGGISIGVSGFGIFGTVDFHITGQNEGITSLYGSISGHAELLVFSFGINVTIQWDAASGRLRASVSVTIDFFFFSVTVGGDFDIGYIKSTITYQAGTLADGHVWDNNVGGALYVNVGARATYRNYSVTETAEQVLISQAADGGIEVSIFGKKKKYMNVTAVYIDTGSGNDYINVDSSVTVPVFINAGSGDDYVDYNSAVAGNIIGGDGKDVINGGPGNDLIYGDNVGASSGGDVDIIHGNGGNDTIYGGEGDDVIVGGTGVDSLHGDSGNDTFAWTVGDGNDSLIDGGTGTNTLDIAGDDTANSLTISANAANFTALIDGATLNPTGIQAVFANMRGGADTVTINDLTGTILTSLDIDLGAGATPGTSDGAADSVIINGTGSDDVFRLNSTSTLLDISKVASITNATTLVDYHIENGSYPADSVTINGGNGNDLIDARNVTNAWVTLKLYGQNGNDTIIGSSFNDVIDGGANDDTLTGGPGVDTFADSGGNDTLVENMDVNYTLNGWQLTAGGDVETLPAVFENISLSGGNSDNTFTISNAATTITLNGGEGSDTYIVNIAGAGFSTVNIADSGTGVGFTNTNTMKLYGTNGADDFLLRAGVITAGNLPASHLETINFAGMSAFELHGGNGGDTFIVDETTVAGVIYGEGGNDSFTIGRILTSNPDNIATVATTRGALTYGNRATLDIRGGDGNDSFEANHNQAALQLYGEAGDDLFNVKTFLAEGSALSTVSGGTGSNTIQYIQNGPLLIDGGEGFDRLVVSGTEADDVFIITDTQIFGGGRQITFTNIESIVIQGEAGNDTFWVLGNGLPLEIDGGSGNDTINIGGQAPDYVYDAPPIVTDPPPYTVYTPVFSAPVHVSFDIAAHFYFDGSFPFFHWAPAFHFSFDFPPVFLGYTATVIDPPPVTYDPPPITYHFANVTNFNGVVHGVEVYNSNNTTPVTPGPGITPSSYLDLGGFNSPLKVDGGIDNDTLNINLSSTTTNLTGSLRTTEDLFTDSDGTVTDNGPIGQLLGLGLPDTFSSQGRTFTGGITFLHLESAYVNLGSGNDTFTIGTNEANSPVAGLFDGTFDGVNVTVNGNGGNDTFNVLANSGTVTLNGGANNDTFNLGSNAPNLTAGVTDRLQGGIVVDGGTGTDSLNLDDRGATNDNVLTLTQTAITGMDMAAAGVTYAGMETLFIGFGSGADIANVRGTLASTTLQLNNGDDSVYISSTANVTTATRATTTTLGGTLDDIDGALLVDGGNGRQRLMVSDADSSVGKGTLGAPVVMTNSTITGLSTGVITYKATASGDFSNGITVWTGSGADFVDVNSEFLRTGIRNSTSLNTGAGADHINVRLAATPYGFLAVNAGSGDDFIDTTGGSLDLLIFGGDGADTIATGAGNHLIFGDNGSAVYLDSGGNIVARYGSGGVDDFTDGIIRALSSATTVSPGTGGADSITTAGGNDLIFGGAGGDLINAGEGNNLVFGDQGAITLVAGLLTLADSLLTGGGNDTITTGAGRDLIIGGSGQDTINTGAGDNVVFGDHGTITLSGNVVTSAFTMADADGGIDHITTLGGRDVILGGEAGDVIDAGDGDNLVAGDHGTFTLPSATALDFSPGSPAIGGDDTITTGTGNDTIIGGVGADTITAGNGLNVVLGDQGTVTRDMATGSVVATSTTETIGGIDHITTGDDSDVIIGGAAGDTITAGAGYNVILGDAGTATLSGGLPVAVSTTAPGAGGNDTITTGGSSDVILGGDGADTIDAGAGLNVVFGDYGSVTWSGSSLVLATATAQGFGGADTITTGADDDFVFGGEAGDVINGGAGNNVVFGDQGSVTFTGGLATTLTSAAAAGDGNDQITTTTGHDVIVGGGGSDAIDAGAGDNTVVGDFASIIQAVSGSVLTTTTVTSTDIGTGGDDTITTGDQNDFIIGGAGNDTINAGRGTNVVLGDEGQIQTVNFQITLVVSDTGAGVDSITTGDGTDLIAGGGAGDTIVAGAGTNVVLGDHGTITLTAGVLASVESTTSNGGDDTITAGSGYNLIIGGFGADHITTGGGENVLVGDQGRIDVAGITLVSATTKDAGTGGDDVITTGDGQNWILGGDGVDTITAGNGFAAVFGDDGRISLAGDGTITLVSLDFASGGDDTITTGSGDDLIVGGSGSDLIQAGEGNNVVLGDHGQIVTKPTGLVSVQSLAPTQGAADIIYTGSGNDVIIGGAGADQIHAGAGNNIILGDLGSLIFSAGVLTEATSSDYTIGGNDFIETTTGNDIIIGGIGQDTIHAGDGDNVVLGDQGTIVRSNGILVDVQTDQPGVGDVDTIVTGSGNDVVLGGQGSDYINAGDGNNVIIGDHGSLHWVAGILARMLSTDFASGGADSITTGTGADVILAGPDKDTIDAGAGDNIVFGDNGAIYWTGGVIDQATTLATNVGDSDTITTGSGNDIVFGGTGNEVITAGDGDNLVFGDNGTALFAGGIRVSYATTAPADAGNDTITTGTGNDTILAGAGADTIVAGDGNNVVIADEGQLTYDSAGVLADALSLATSSGAADTITTGSGNDTIIGGTGNDVIVAGDGNNLVFGDSGEAAYLAGVPVKFDTFAPADAGNDTITTGSGNDTILAGAGADTIVAGDGNNVVIADEGQLTYDSAGVLADALSLTTSSGAADSVTTGSGNDIILGGTGDDVITAGDGNNLVFGDNGEARFLAGVPVEFATLAPADAGNDTITTGSGNDTILAGAGSDAVVAGDGANVVIADEGQLTYDSAGVLADALSLAAASGAADTVTTGSGNDTVFGGTGSDVIVAGDGNNLVFGDNGEARFLAGVPVEFVTFAPANAGSDTITTGLGNDTILAGAGADTIVAGDGTNVVIADEGQLTYDSAGVLADALSLATSSGAADSVTTGSGNDTIIGGTGDDVIVAGDGNNLVFGDNGEARFLAGVPIEFDTFAPADAGSDTITTGLGNDTILAGAGSDAIVAGDGNNVVIADEGQLTYDSAGVLADALSLATSSGAADSVTTGSGNDIVFGGKGNDVITAGDGDNLVFGDNGEARFLAGVPVEFDTFAPADAGNDTITTGLGNDTILAGAGADTIVASDGNNVVIADEGQLTYDSAGVLADALSLATSSGAADSVTTGSGNDIILGGTGDDVITAGDGNNLVFGDNGEARFLAGVPVKFDTFAPADAGNDTITTGSGNDTILAGAGADTILAGDGNNVVIADEGQLTYDSAGVLADALSLTTSSGAADSVTTGSGNDTIIGGTGNDVIVAGDGDNLVFGDNGEARFLAGVPVEFDTFAPADAGNDTITTGSGNDTILAGAGADTILAGDGNNVVIADEGQLTYDSAGVLADALSLTTSSGAADSVTTGSGNDIILGGTGDDVITAGDGNNLVFGDNGEARFLAGVPVEFATLAPADAGNDTITTGLGNDTILAGAGADTIVASDGNNVVIADEGQLTYDSAGVLADALSLAAASGAADSVTTGSGNDTIIGGAGDDVIVAGDGDNLVFGDNGEARLLAGVPVEFDTFAPADAGNDTITTGSGNDTILAGAGSDAVVAGDGANVVIADEGQLTYDSAGGLADALSLATSAGAADTITTGSGNDLIIGGTGDDVIAAGDGANLVFGDSGEAAFLAGVPVDFKTFNPTDAGNDTITTGSGNDTILAGAGKDTVAAGDGNNVIIADEGELTYDAAGLLAEAVSLTPSAGANDMVTSGAGNDLIIGGFGQDTINAGQGDNLVFGDNGEADYSGGRATLYQTLTPVNSASDVIVTGSGNDTILAGDGADTISAGDGNNIILGDEGSITLLAGVPQVITSAAVANGAGDTITSGSGRDLIIGGTGADTINAGDGANVIIGDNGVLTLAGGQLVELAALSPTVGSPDLIVSGAGNDVIMAGAGGDIINAGDGDNVVVGDHATVDFAGGLLTLLTPTTPEIGGNDTITTGAGNDLIVAGTGSDWINAGDGNNVVAGDHARVSATGGVLTTVESVAPAEGDVDLIFTGAGNDLIIGGTGGDTIHSGAGNDLVFGDNALITGTIDLSLLPLAMAVKPFTYTSIYTQNVDANGRALGGDDVVFAGAGDDIVFGQQGADILFGGDGNDDLIGGHNVAGGQDGADVIDGGAGYDVIAGDNASVLRTGDNVSPRAHVLTGTAMFDDNGNFLDSSAPQAWPTNVPERAIVILDHAFDTAPGLYGNDSLVGGAGDDMIFGELGDDRIHGDAMIPVTVAADGTIDRGAVRAAADALFTTNLWQGAATDGADYIEGNGGSDLIFGGLGQDDIVGGSSSMFGLLTPQQRPDAGDIIYGGNGTAAGDGSFGDLSPNGHARDADVILGDNGNIIRLVGTNGVNAGAFLTFSYNTTGTEKIIVRGFQLLDYTVPAAASDIGGNDVIYGEAGDDTLHGEVGSDILYGNGQDDNLYAGGGADDSLYGGAGDDSTSSGGELRASPPASNGAATAAVDGTGATGTLSGTFVFFVPANVPAALWFGADNAPPKFILPPGFFTSFSTSSPWISSGSGHHVFGGEDDDGDWRVFSSGLLPAEHYGEPTVDYTPAPLPPENPLPVPADPAQQTPPPAPPAGDPQPPAPPASGDQASDQSAEQPGAPDAPAATGDQQSSPPPASAESGDTKPPMSY